nr:immunoglobulin heavy chain junction region [Mus musculus]
CVREGYYDYDYFDVW